MGRLEELVAALILLGALALAAVSCRPLESEEKAPSAPADPPVMSQQAQREIVARYANLFAAKGGTFWPNTWLGIPTLQNPNDA